ncbi:DUF1080 domain-containing protein [Flavihumibacter cheonanensis]|jgi:hypothetical protein|uniref:3-keto-disaccharide hydrolase n=1 Tax=Flavihumibacter cheonanensis TaxID=1442385 RepID=UPI001EF93939|nr:DUF1080 domain-containing protein [Flavihumibacter cheonanensis]MCG7750987.1 DUF1080 domain-containing protein [Flavihumibacter cheonanensis]
MIKNLMVGLALIGMAGCSSSKELVADNTLSKKEKKEGWVLLFDGTTTKGWHTYGKNEVGAAWKVANGTIYLDASNKAGWQTSDGGDIVTNEAFENYHFKVEWKIAPNGNSGIIFNVKDDRSKYKHVWYTGMEMQVLDNNGHPDAKIRKHRAGDLYDLIESSQETVKPVGEWNLAEIIQNNGQLELKLNGTTIVKTTLWDDAWKKLVANSKFKDLADFGVFRSGHISLQDHGDNVWYKNIKIRKL